MEATLQPDIISSRLEGMSVAAICSRCREETARYRRGESFDDGVCCEVFRRAVVERDEDCWRELHSIYRDQVVSWCRRASLNPVADLEELVTDTWEKFWRNFTAEKFALSSGSGAILRYLKMCARSAAIDAARLRPRGQHLTENMLDLSDEAPTPDEAHATRDANAKFWELVNGSLHSQSERVLVHLTYEIGLKPAEVQARHPDLCPSVQDVYRMTRNILDRLKRNRDLHDWFGQSGF